jgi:hypothetical protein
MAQVKKWKIQNFPYLVPQFVSFRVYKETEIELFVCNFFRG